MAWTEDPDRDLWAPPVTCRGCGQPMPQGLEACPSCGRPHGLAPGARARLLVEGMANLPRWLGRRAADLSILALCLGAGLVALPFSPVLVLFPLLMVPGGPLGRRPGRRRGRRRQRRGQSPPPA